MDLKDLRSYIESQRIQLQQEREALKSERRLPAGRRTPEILEQAAGGHKVKATHGDYASLISDALSQRISSLNTFKDQVLHLANEEENLEPSEYCGIEISRQNVNDYNQGVSTSQTGTTVTAAPSLIARKNSSSQVSSAAVTENTRGQQEGISINLKERKISASTIRSREEEVELLQEKLASASFWDDFGRSATTKKWGPEVPDTMVRIGEFSPANPDLQAPGKALLGLGEYEERRRQLLERKKQEYKDFLAQNRNYVQRTDHLEHPLVKNQFDVVGLPNEVLPKSVRFSPLMNAVDVSTQTEYSLIEQHNENSILSGSVQATLSGIDPVIQPLSPRVPRAHTSQTTEQLPDARMRQLQLQEELRLQIEEKRRIEAERRKQERTEEEALQKRVAEQQARLQVEYERDERLRREREIQKQQQIEDFQRRQEELRAESEALKLEERRQKHGAAETCCQKQSQHSASDASKGSNKNVHLIPPTEVAPLSLIKSSSPPLRSPRRKGEHHRYFEEGPPSPRALIKVLDGPTLPKQGRCLEDSLPIPLMPVTHNHPTALPPHKPPSRSLSVSPHRSPQHSPNRSPDRSPRRSPSRFVTEQNWSNDQSNHLSTVQGPSEAMRNLEERWKVPAVQKNVCVRGRSNVQNSSGNVLTQLGAFRRQLQLEHMRMEETVRQKHQSNQYNQKYYQQHNPQRGHQY